MIFAAGLGTRMRPLTAHTPKALLEVGGKTLLEIAIQRLIHFGFDEIIVNVHHFAGQIEQFIAQNKSRWQARIEVSDESDQLLDTGGGLKKARWFFDDGRPFLCCNADILSSIDLGQLYNAHLHSDAIATFAVQQRETSRYMLFDDKDIMYGWMNTKTKEVKISRRGLKNLRMYSFSCFQVLDPAIFNLTPQEEAFSIIDLYLKLSAYHKVAAFHHPVDFWLDVGVPSALVEANRLMSGFDLPALR